MFNTIIKYLKKVWEWILKILNKQLDEQRKQQKKQRKTVDQKG